MMKITKKKKTKKIIKNYNSIFVDDYIYIYTHTRYQMVFITCYDNNIL